MGDAVSRQRTTRAGWAAAGLLALCVPAWVGLTAVHAGAAASGCSVAYTVTSRWGSGFNADVKVTNLGDPLSSWTLTWTFAAGQAVAQGWNGTFTQSGTSVSVRNAAYNGSLPTGGSVTPGFTGSGSADPVPTAFALNGVACTGGTTSPTPTATPTGSPTGSPTASPTVTPTPTPTQTGAPQRLPSSFRWSSSGALITPRVPGQNVAGVKDPSVVYSGGKYHVFFSIASSAGYNLAYTSFTDWSQAGTAQQYYLGGVSAIGAGYRAAPEVFYFAPQRLWYLVYQTGNASYSTNPDIGNPSGWSAPRNFYAGTPDIISRNIGNGYWVDMWVSCDSAYCYLFSSDDNGHLYRSRTSLANYPNGFDEPVIVLQDSNPYALFEASNVYKVGNTNQYLLIVEAIGSTGRYFRSWTSTSLGGSWTPYAASESNPFAGAANVSFPGGTWTRDISHGEAVRTSVDQTLTIDPCHLQYLYQGMAPGSGGDYNNLPWRLGLLTLTNPAC
jgi:hypothetical protein